MSSFPDNDLLRHLRVVTQDADRCSSVAQQLLNGKRQTRYTHTYTQAGEWPSTNPFCIVSEEVTLVWVAMHLCHIRYRAGGGKTQNQLTVEEMRSFVRQLYNLPCSLIQAPLLKVTQSHSLTLNISIYLLYQVRANQSKLLSAAIFLVWNTDSLSTLCLLNDCKKY